MGRGAMTIPVVVVPQNPPGSVFELEVGGTVLSEQHDAALPGRNRRGFGRGRPGRTGFGVIQVRGDRLRFGLGRFGEGALLRELSTRAAFDAGDRSVRVRVRDGRLGGGNASGWSSAVTIRHRPAQAAPTDLAMSGTSLQWSGQ